MQLPRLSNSDFERAERLAAMSGIPLDHCPTCGAEPVKVDDDTIVDGANGTFRFRGATHSCDCEEQKLLRKHYLVANIPDQYQRLHWDDYTGSQEVRDIVASFLEKWKFFRVNGMGMEFYGSRLGTGKTFAATYVGKELVKLGERVFFIDFKEVISAYEETDDDVSERLRESTVLILDEVVPAVSERQAQFFAFKLEELVRHRTNFNLPTIMTTNLEPDRLHEAYPRTYSLLEAKQVRVELSGEDARRQRIALENIELAMNEEVRPIT